MKTLFIVIVCAELYLRVPKKTFSLWNFYTQMFTCSNVLSNAIKKCFVIIEFNLEVWSEITTINWLGYIHRSTYN